MSLLLENRNEVGMYNKRRSSLLKAYLLSACTLALGVSRAADAATVPGASSSIKGHGGAGQHGGAGASKGDSTEKVPEVVSVSAGIRSANGVTNTTPGGGMMPHQTAAKSKGGVTRDFIAKQSATASVTSLISQLPGVNVASQGPTNMNQDNIHIRGFDATRIGFLLEGIPLADPISYYSYSAAMVDPENLGSVTVTQGSPDMESPVFNAVGGEVSSTLINPSARAGAYLSVTGGTRALNKEFLRLETGQIGNSGVRGFVSFSHTSSNMWMGPGRTRRYLVNAKFVKEWGDGNSINAIFGFSQQDATYNYMPTQAVWEKYGRSATYNGQYYPGDTAYYKLNARAVNYEYLVAPMNFHIARELRLKFTPYLVRNWGYASAGSSIPYENGYIGNQRYDVLPVNTAQNGKVTAQLGNPYEDRTAAQNIALNWDHGISHLTFGYWYSYTTRSSIYNYSAVSATGEAPNSTGTQPIVVDGRKLVTADSFITQQINTFYLMESLSLLGNRLKVGAGLRASMVHFDALNKVPGASVPRVTPSFFEPLPQVWGSFDIDPHNQIYVNGSTAFKPAAGNFAYLNLYSPSSPTPTQVPNMVPPEYAISEEIGYRHTGFVNFSMALFNNNMTNYQVVSSRYAPNSTYLVSSVIDIGGGVTSRGAQAEIGLRQWHHLSPYISAQYLHATMDNNYKVGNDALPTAGKILVASPKFTGAVGIQYDDGSMFGNFTFNYVSSQYSTFMDDQKLPAYTTSNLTLGYRFHSFSRFRYPQVQLNLLNIGDSAYRSGINGYATTAKARQGIHGTTIAAGSPTYTVGSGFAALVSLSSAF